MITILSKFFLRDKDITDSKGRKSYGTLCSVLGIVLNFILFALKYFAGFISGSVAIMADAFNNLSDAGSSFITLIGFVFAGKKPDTEHPFGHGRFEYLSGLFVALIIVLMGFELIKSSFDKIIHPEDVDTSVLAMGILVISILVKLYMFFYNNKIGKKINSSAMKATATDSLGDSVATAVVLIAMIVMRFTNINIDGYCGILVAMFIIYAGYGAAKETISPLLGSLPDEELVESIQEIVMAHDEVCGIHDLVVHDYGPGRIMISLHAEVPGDGNIFELHDAIDRIEKELSEKLYCEAVIHLDPVETNNVVVKEIKALVAKKIKIINPAITIHDFRIVTGPTHTNLIFDAVMPYEVKMSPDELKMEIEKMVKTINPEYYSVVHIDRTYI